MGGRLGAISASKVHEIAPCHTGLTLIFAA
jgi:hypothetical protein